MQGKRLVDNEIPKNPGEYSKHTVIKSGVDEIGWMVKAPNGGPPFIIGFSNDDGSAYHWVQENPDGTITVRPQPEDAPPARRNSNSIETKKYTNHPEWYWHGYIYNGEWKSA